MDLAAESPEDVLALLSRADYVADTATATTVLLADRLGKPILIEGPPGCGKTELAKALAESTGTDLVRLQCYRGLDAENAVYEWDHMKQFLRIRAEGESDAAVDPADIEDSIFEEEYLLERPILRALRNGDRSVLLIDEIDRAGEDFEAFLLEVLDEFQISIPELGTVSAADPPLVVLTSNRTRKIGDALKRRCVYLHLDHPSPEKELEIVQTRVPELDAALSERVVEFVQALRQQEEFLRTPGIAETIDWASALAAIGATELTTDTVVQSLGTVLKEPRDIESLDEERIETLIRATEE
jgi:MoxR-like ATPase